MTSRIAIGLAASLALSACSDGAPSPPVPASSASASVAPPPPPDASAPAADAGPAAPPPGVHLRRFEAPEPRGVELRADGRALVAWHNAWTTADDGTPQLA